MGKRARSTVRREAELAREEATSVQRVLPMVEVLVKAGQALHELVVSTGMQVLEALLEDDRVALCGPRGKHQGERKAYRHGKDRGMLVLGGRKVSVRKPRVRSIAGEEMSLPSWDELAAEDPLQRRVLEQMLVGVSTRQYERSLEDLPAPLRSVASRKSSVSRRFVARTRAQVDEFLCRSVEGLDLPVLMFDGTAMGDHVLIVALGIDTEGCKHILGVREGTTESFEVCRSLLRELIERGLVVERPRLVVIDGSKGLDKALRLVFGRWIRIQRCQVHKLRNVREHLPKSRWPWVREKLRQAWLRSSSAEEAKSRLLHLAASLEVEYPSAAGSIREGIDETLTLNELELPVEALYRTLRSTNPIENLQGRIQGTARRVKRWRSGSMVLRWAVSGMMEAEKSFRRIRGYRYLTHLDLALRNAIREETVSESSDKDRRIA